VFLSAKIFAKLVEFQPRRNARVNFFHQNAFSTNFLDNPGKWDLQVTMEFEDETEDPVRMAFPEATRVYSLKSEKFTFIGPERL
jgi:hypothetical protein